MQKPRTEVRGFCLHLFCQRKLVDPKGIEPSNLTDANRALSQLSYGPVYSRQICHITASLPGNVGYYTPL